MTAATLRQIAAAEAIEKKAIHMVPSSYRGFHRVPSGCTKFSMKAADNARPVRGFPMEPVFVSPKISFCGG
jgi:hypothetical protein